MAQFTESARAWGTPEFQNAVKREIECLGASDLPLQQGLTRGSYAIDEGLRATIIRVRQAPNCIRVRAGIFYVSIIAGCNCADDPTPVEPQPEYCEVDIKIDSPTGQATIALADTGDG